jgi:hypothetical protein
MICHCIVATADGRVLLVPGDGDRWTLPRLSNIPDDWFPYNAAAIARELKSAFGVDTYVTRHLREDPDSEFCEVAVIGPGWNPAGTRWFDAETVLDVPVEPAGSVAALRGWAEARRVPPPDRRAPWERPGWLALALLWIQRAATHAGFDPVGPAEPVKLGWPGSAILGVPVHGETLFFKAAYARPPNEVEATLAFGERFPREVPAVIAHDAARGWLLMRDVGGRTLRSTPDESWAGAVRRFAQIQIECAGDVELFRRAGLPLRSGAVVVRAWESMLEAIGRPSPVPLHSEPDLLDRLQALRPVVESKLDTLFHLPLPLSVHATDFREANVYAREPGFVFFDWGDTALSHPFFSIQRFLDTMPRPTGVRRSDPALDDPRDGFRRGVSAAYLEPWRERWGSATVDRAFVLSRELADLAQALHWHEELEWIEPGTPWHQRVLLARATHMRRALLRLDPRRNEPVPARAHSPGSK